MKWYLKVLKNYANFDGRARRKEYWMYQLFNLIFIYGTIGIFSLLSMISEFLAILGVILVCLYIVAVFIPSVAVSIRRLHDINQSGAWVLISLVPLGGFVLLILMCTDGTVGPNQYGSNPKEIQSE